MSFSLALCVCVGGGGLGLHPIAGEGNDTLTQFPFTCSHRMVDRLQGEYKQETHAFLMVSWKKEHHRLIFENDRGYNQMR